MTARRSGRLIAALTAAGLLTAVTPTLAEPSSVGSTTMAAANRPVLNGYFSTYADGRRGQNSPSIRQDWDITSDLEAHYGPASRDWSMDLHVRGIADVDGRRPADEPGIYNGIQETFRRDEQARLYRASFERGLGQDLGVAELTRFRLGRQYHTEGDFLWFDGLELEGRIPASDMDVAGTVFGGVPVRIYESATDDWLAGGSLSILKGGARIGLEAYHVEDRDKLGFLRRDNVGRLSVATPIGDQARFEGVARVIDDGEFDGRGRVTVDLTRGIQVRGDYRVQGEDRGPHATELDAASLVLGRSVGVFRRAWQEYGGDVMIPLSDHLSLDIGGITHESRDPIDTYNLNFDRYFASLSLTEIPIAGKKFDISVTGEAYQTAFDWTRAVSGEISVALSPTLRASAGSSYALYSYDYTSATVRQNVRTGTARLVWNAKKNLRLEGRYDIEDDDFRLHHYVRTGFRYDF